MKRIFFTIIALIAISTSVMANGQADSVRYLTTRWNRNWFVSADATINWWQGSMRMPEGFTNSYTKVYWEEPHFGVSVNFGKWINHKTAVRLSYDNTVINSFINGRHNTPNQQHIQYLYGDEPELVESVNGIEVYKTFMHFKNLSAQYMVSPIDFFQGYYNPNRIWTPVLYASAGAALTSNRLFFTQNVIDYVNYSNPHDLTKIDGTNFELSLGAGLLNNFRLGEHLDLNLDIKWNFFRWTIDSWAHETNEYNSFFTENDQNIRPKRFDNMYTAALGLTYYFSRIYELCEQDTCPCAENVMPSDTIVKIVTLQADEMVSYPFSVFFHRDSYELMSNRDLVNLAEIARVALEYNYKIRLRGSCDSATATPSYNQTLSENRCRKIMSELMKMGVPENQFILVPKGGIKELDPTEYDRRVVIELVKD
jgi:outer membrane protein OmpA-like peptidoglycan-associated protein